MYNITGIPEVDQIFSIVIKIILAFFLIVVAWRSVTLFRKGDYPQLIISSIIALILIAGLVGINNVAELGKKFVDLFQTGSTAGNKGGIFN